MQAQAIGGPPPTETEIRMISLLKSQKCSCASFWIHCNAELMCGFRIAMSINLCKLDDRCGHLRHVCALKIPSTSFRDECMLRSVVNIRKFRPCIGAHTYTYVRTRAKCLSHRASSLRHCRRRRFRIRHYTRCARVRRPACSGTRTRDT